MNKGLTYFQSNQRLESLAVLHRIAQTERTGVEDCLETYGNLVWALAKKYTASNEEAEAAIIKIFKDIWKCASHYDSAKCTEEKYILRIVFRHLLNQSSLKH